MAAKAVAAPAATIAFCLVLIAVAEAQDPPRFRSGVEVVSLDATVVDRTGKPISDLLPKDFQVTVDGKMRRVVTAQFIDHLDSASSAAVNPAAADPGLSASALPVSGRTVLILFDEDSILTADGLMARKAARTLLDKLNPRDRVGVNFIPRLRSNFNLTTDRTENRKALDAWVPGEYREPLERYRISLREASDIARGDGMTLNEVVLRECVPPAPKTCRIEIVDDSRQIVRRSAARGTQTLDALKGLALDFRRIPGPKTMILVSGGSRKPEDNSSFEQMAKEFAAAEFSLYTIFLEKSEYNIARGRPSPTQYEDDQMELRELGNTTSVVGGTFLHAVGTLEPLFQRVALELSGEYLLGIEAEPADRDGRPHRVTIKVNRKDVDVRGRKQYVIPVQGPASVQSPAPVQSPEPVPSPASVQSPAPSVPIGPPAVETLAASQTQARPPAYAPAYAPARFVGGVEVVALDASVVDWSGRPATGLTPEDFHVSVDGNRRRVVSAQFVNSLKSGGRNVIVVFDQDSLEIENGLAARRASQALLDALSPLDRVGLNLLPRLRGSFTLTTDRAENQKDIRSWAPGAYRELSGPYWIGVTEAIEIARMDQTTLDKVARRECSGLLPQCRSDVSEAARQLAASSAARGGATMKALLELATGLRKIAGPKTVILMSSGIRQPESNAVLEQLEAEFAAAEITLYSLFFKKSEADRARYRLSPTQTQDDFLEKSWFENVTSSVGGTLLEVSDGAEPLFQRIALELSASYLLDLEVAPGDRDGKPHRVAIEVNRPGVDVRGRKQYVIPAVK